MHPEEMMPHPDYSTLVSAKLLQPQTAGLVPQARSFIGLIYADVLGWRPLRLDLHVPETPGPHPVVAYVHGGSFLAGIPEMGPWLTLPTRGIAIASLSYRFSGEVGFPEPVEDVRAALRWIVDQGPRFDLDVARLALWGSSAGAYLASLVAILGDEPLGRKVGSSTTPVQLSAMINHYGVSAPELLKRDAINPDSDDDRALEMIMEKFFGATQLPTSILDHLESAEGVPPFLIMHGDDDHRVGIEQSRRLHSGLLHAGVSSELVIVPGADHGTPEFAEVQVIDRVVDFLHESWSWADD